MRYRYRLWGINWLPLLAVAIAELGLWSYLKYYDVNALDELKDLRWKLPLQVFGWLCLARALYCGWFRVRFAYYALWAATLFFEVGQSVYRHDGLRFILSLILGVLLYGAYSWIEARLDNACVNPRLKWYVGKLSSIPHLQAEFQINNGPVIQTTLRAIDETGAFVMFSEVEQMESRSMKGKISLKLKYRSTEVEAKGRAVASLDWEQSGLGLQFFFDDLYHQTQYTKLVQQLKGEGLA